MSSAGLIGCAPYDWRAEVANQASFDHRCPVEAVRVLRDNGDRMARSVELDVCGRIRMYRDIGENRFMWQDMTEAQGGTAPAPSMGTSGGAAPAAPWQ